MNQSTTVVDHINTGDRYEHVHIQPVFTGEPPSPLMPPLDIDIDQIEADLTREARQGAFIVASIIVLVIASAVGLLVRFAA